MKIRYGEPFGTLETIDVIVNLDYPVFYFAMNEKKDIYLVYVYSEYGTYGNYEEVLLIPYTEKNYKKVLKGQLSLLDSIIKCSEIYLLIDYYDDNGIDYKKINPDSLNIDRLPAKDVYFQNGDIIIKNEEINFGEDSFFIKDANDINITKLESKIDLDMKIDLSDISLYYANLKLFEDNIMFEQTDIESLKWIEKTRQVNEIFDNEKETMFENYEMIINGYFSTLKKEPLKLTNELSFS